MGIKDFIFDNYLCIVLIVIYVDISKFIFG